jgi:hypothetical protein
MSNENKTISWKASEFKHYPKTTGWYLALVCITLLVMAFFIIVESDIFAAISLGIIAILIIIFSRQLPMRVEIELNTKGVKFGSLFYPYKQLKYFWVVHNPRHQTVNLETTAMVNSMVILELDGQDPDVVRDYLLKYLPEHSEIEETFGQKIMHKFKF